VPSLAIAATESADGRDDTPIASLYVKSVMFFPADAAKRQAFLHGAIAESFLDAVKNDGSGDGPYHLVSWALTAAPSFPQAIDDAVRPSACSTKRDANLSLHGGMIAGYILLIPLAMQFLHSRSVGLGASYRVLIGWLGNENRLLGAKRKESLAKTWRRYQSVAHLWAAFILLDEKKRTPRPAFGELREFLSLSECIRRWAEQYRPQRARKPLLDRRTTWKVPARFPIIDVSPDTLKRAIATSVTIPDKWVRAATGCD
jgi:hypothetical protein